MHLSLSIHELYLLFPMETTCICWLSIKLYLECFACLALKKGLVEHLFVANTKLQPLSKNRWEKGIFCYHWWSKLWPARLYRSALSNDLWRQNSRKDASSSYVHSSF